MPLQSTENVLTTATALFPNRYCRFHITSEHASYFVSPLVRLHSKPPCFQKKNNKLPSSSANISFVKPTHCCPSNSARNLISVRIYSFAVNTKPLTFLIPSKSTATQITISTKNTDVFSALILETLSNSKRYRYTLTLTCKQLPAVQTVLHLSYSFLIPPLSSPHLNHHHWLSYTKATLSHVHHRHHNPNTLHAPLYSVFAAIALCFAPVLLTDPYSHPSSYYTPFS